MFERAAPVEGGDWWAALERLLDEARVAIADVGDPVEWAAISLLHDARRVDPFRNERDRNWLYSNVYRGLLGVAIDFSRSVTVLSPIQIVARNRGVRAMFEEFAGARGRSWEQFAASAKVTAFWSDQVLVPIADGTPALHRHRWTRVVSPEEVSKASATALADRLGSWLLSHVDEQGRLTYVLDPARGDDPDPNDNNMIRQWMATIAMTRFAKATGAGREVFDVVKRNVDFNLRHYYRAERELGFIEWGGTIKLGSIALAALALVESVDRAAYERPERKLLASLDAAFDAARDGSFVTMFKPHSTTHGRNFYPGETLLTWATVWCETRSPQQLERFMTAFRYWRRWHRENRNPAFIPWHTQAYFLVWKETRDDQLRDFVFEMNDWLIEAMQQLDGAKLSYPEILGRFYNAKQPGYGSPHSSSDGVYLEGLIDAFEMARMVGDATRVERYRVSIVAALRNLLQLHYRDEADAFFAKDPRRAVGAVRTSLYNVEVRCDNVQHNLMGLLRVLDRFTPEDYAHPDLGARFDVPQGAS